MQQGDFFLIYAATEDFDVLFIQTTDPITWTEDIMNAKTFATFESAKMDFVKEYEIYRNIVKNTDYKSIWIMQSDKNYYAKRREQIL